MVEEGRVAAEGRVVCGCSCRRILTTSSGAMQKRLTRPATPPETTTWILVPYQRISDCGVKGGEGI